MANSETQSQETPELKLTTTGSQVDLGSSSASGASRGAEAKGEATERSYVEQACRCADFLLQMPVDIMFEITGYLTPGDLVAMSCVGGILREALNSPSFSVVWTEARKAAEVPNCPPRLSEPQWAALLFGPPVCEWCGATNVHHVELHVQRRACARCKRKYLISTVEFPNLFPNCDPAVLDMVPYTLTGGWPLHGYEGKFFWSYDIVQVGKKWTLLQDDIKARAEGSRGKAVAYRKRKVREVKCIAKHANEFHYWVHNLGVEARTKAMERNITRFDEIQTRLLALGYDKQDITYTAFYPPEFQEGSELTDESWSRIQPRAVALVESRREARLEGERDLLRIRRIKVLQELYVEYAKSVLPRQWCYLPDIRDLIEFPALKGIVEDNDNVPASPSVFQSAVEQLPTLIQGWISAKKARVTAMLNPPSGAVDNPLDLAASVLECTNSPCFGRCSQRYENLRLPLISWEVVAAHSCQPASQCLPVGHTPTSVGVSHLGGITAAALVREAGLDPSSATAAQMDALDLRFACLECLSSDPRNRKMVGYPWRSAVEHGMMKEHTSWRKMSSEDAVYIRKEERGFANWWKSWSCSHCADHFNDWRRRNEVVRHSRDVHQIPFPKEPTDFFWYPGEYFSICSDDLGSIKISESMLLGVANV